MTPVFVTPDDFKNSAKGGFDLRDALEGSFNESLSAEDFLEDVTDHLMDWIDTVSFRNYKWDRMTPFQLEKWKDAIIVQAKYTYNEGLKALGEFSGTDDEKGQIFTIKVLRDVEVCIRCREILQRAGLLNFNIKNRRRHWPNGSNYGFF